MDPINAILKTLSFHWTTVLIFFSTVSSFLSLATSQTSIYFSSAGKQNQKTLTRRLFIFTLILLQVIPKVLAFQAFVFGVVKEPNAVMPVIWILPFLSSLFKSLTMTAVFSLSLKSCLTLNLSPFIFTRIDEVKMKTVDANFNEENHNKRCMITKFGKYHVIFDSLSLLENFVLVMCGSIGKSKL